MNKGIWAIIAVAAFAVGALYSADLATAAKPITEVFVTNSACPAESVQHWDKVVFTIPVDLQPPEESSLPFIKGDREYDIKFQETPEEVESITDLKRKVQSRLIDLGYTVPGPSPQPPTNADAFNIVDVEYSIICASSEEPPRR